MLTIQIKRGDSDNEKSNPPITMKEFEALTRDAGGTRQTETSYRLMDSADTAKCLLNYDVENASINLQVSMSNPKFAHVVRSVFESGAKVAAHLGATATESLEETVLDSGRLAEVIDEDGTYFANLLKSADNCLVELNEAKRGAVEFPVNGMDSVDDYFAFLVKTSGPLTANDLEKATGFPVRYDERRPDHFAIYDKLSQRPIGKVYVCDKGIEIHPFYWKAHFSQTTRETMQIADLIAATCGGELFFFDEPMTPSLRARIEEHSVGLGVNFMTWAASALTRC